LATDTVELDPKDAYSTLYDGMKEVRTTFSSFDRLAQQVDRLGGVRTELSLQRLIKRISNSLRYLVVFADDHQLLKEDMYAEAAGGGGCHEAKTSTAMDIWREALGRCALLGSLLAHVGRGRCAKGNSGICPRSMRKRTMSSRADLERISMDVKTLKCLYVPFVEYFPFMLHLRWAGQKSVLKSRAGIGRQCMSVTRFETGSAQQLRHAFEQIRGARGKGGRLGLDLAGMKYWMP